jgi:hypothetical protein
MLRGICCAVAQVLVAATIIYQACLLVHAINTIPIRHY